MSTKTQALVLHVLAVLGFFGASMLATTMPFLAAGGFLTALMASFAALTLAYRAGVEAGEL